MKAILTTICGCTRTIDVPHNTTRIFVYEGEYDHDGNMILREQPENCSNCETLQKKYDDLYKHVYAMDEDL